MKHIQELGWLVASRYGIIYVITWEEGRFCRIATAFFKEEKRKTWFWSMTDGLREQGAEEDKPAVAETEDLFAAMENIKKIATENPKDKNIFIIKDLHPHIDNPLVRRHLRDLAAILPRTASSVILLSPELQLPSDLEKNITVYNWPLPDLEEMKKLAMAVKHNNRKRLKGKLGEDGLTRIAKAALGLTFDEAENVFSKSVAKHGQLLLKEVSEEKKQVLEKHGIRYIEIEETLDDIAGNENVKKYFDEAHAIRSSEEAIKFGCSYPLGVWLVGPAGTAKTKIAQMAGNKFGCCVLEASVNEMQGGLVGESEKNLRRFFDVEKAIGDCVVVMDEAGKQIGRAGNDTSGVKNSMRAMILSHLSRKDRKSFWIFTFNDDVLDMNPEDGRLGRIDGIFFCGLPEAHVREKIVEIHLRLRGRNPRKFDLKKIAENTKGFSGAEIESGIVAALRRAWVNKTDISTALVILSMQAITPMSTTMKTKIERLETWAETAQAQPASTPEVKKKGLRLSRKIS